MVLDFLFRILYRIFCLRFFVSDFSLGFGIGFFVLACCIIVIRVCQRRALCYRRACWDIPSAEDSAQ